MDGERINAKASVGIGGEPRTDEPETGAAARNRLLALGAAAVMMVYAAGFDRTRDVAQHFSADNARPRTPGAANALRATSAPAALAPARRTDSSQHMEAARPATEHHRASPVVVDTARAATVDVSPAPVPVPARTDVAAAVPVVPAPAPASATTLVDTASKAEAVTKLKDGSYSGWGTSRHGDIEAAVVIANGRIVSASITQCLTRYSCSWISPLPPQVVARQSAEVDSVSGATQSSNAFYTAIFEALKLAK